MTTTNKIFRILIIPFMLFAAVFVYILDKFHIDVNPIVSYNTKDYPAKEIGDKL